MHNLVPGALVHGLRHTYAIEPANADFSLYTLMRLLGHESVAASQLYVQRGLGRREGSGTTHVRQPIARATPAAKAVIVT